MILLKHEKQILVFGFGGTDNANTLIDESFVFWGWSAVNIFDIVLLSFMLYYYHIHYLVFEKFSYRYHYRTYS